MNKNLKRRLSVTLCAIILASTLTSCAEAAADTPPQSSDTPEYSQTETNTASDITSPSESVTSTSAPENSIEKDRYEEQIKYYMDLTEALQAEILNIKEDFYVNEYEYKQQISTLEQTITLLKATISALSDGNGENNESISPDSMASKSSFSYVEHGGQITITEFTGNELDVMIPSNIGGFPVVAIGEGAFKGKNVRSVTIPSSVRHIDWFAFNGCFCLESITVPASVTTIEYGAFDYCPSSMAVICPKGSYAEAYAKSRGIKTVSE